VIVAAYNVADVLGDALEVDSGSDESPTRGDRLRRRGPPTISKAQSSPTATRSCSCGSKTGEKPAPRTQPQQRPEATSWPFLFPEPPRDVDRAGPARPDLDILTTDAFLCVGDRIGPACRLRPRALHPLPAARNDLTAQRRELPLGKLAYLPPTSARISGALGKKAVYGAYP
jgi:hypothetical protein